MTKIRKVMVRCKNPSYNGNIIVYCSENDGRAAIMSKALDWLRRQFGGERYIHGFEGMQVIEDRGNKRINLIKSEIKFFTRKQFIALKRIESTHSVDSIALVNDGKLAVEYYIAGKDDTVFNVDKNGNVFNFYGLKKSVFSIDDSIRFFRKFCYDKVFNMIYVFGANGFPAVFSCSRRNNKHGYFKANYLPSHEFTAPRILYFLKKIYISPKKNRIVGFIKEDGKLIGYSWNDLKIPPIKTKLNQQHEFWYLNTTNKKCGRGAFIYSVSGKAFGSLKAAKCSIKMRKLPNCQPTKVDGKWLLEYKKLEGDNLLFPVGGGCYKTVRHAAAGAARRGIKNFSVIEIGPGRYALHVV